MCMHARVAPRVSRLQVELNLRHLHAEHARAHLVPPPMEVPPCLDFEEGIDFSGHDCRCMGPAGSALEVSGPLPTLYL